MPSTKRTMANDAFFDIKTMEDILKDGFKGTVEAEASVVLMGVMQYAATEIIEVSGNAAKTHNDPDSHFTITPNDIMEALTNDRELSQVFNGDKKVGKVLKKSKDTKEDTNV